MEDINNVTSSSIELAVPEQTPSGLVRVVKYTLVRGLMLSLMVVVGLYLTILIINYGGYIDQIFRARIDEALYTVGLSERGMTLEDMRIAYDQIRWAMEEAYGLHQPFLIRSFRFLVNGLTMNWGNAGGLVDLRNESRDVRTIILQRIPYTLLLFTTANVIIFFTSFIVGVFLSQKYNTLLDKFFVTLSPISSIPNWVYGILLTVIFAGELHLLPFNGMFDSLPPATKWGYIPMVARHMVLPVSAVFLSTFFQSVYTWRTVFLINSQEDYVEMSRAKGVPSGQIERDYIIRPLLPYIITNFALMLVTLWQGALILETFFRWPGIGSLFLLAIRTNEREVVVGLFVIFAWLMAFTFFFLDIIYAIVDPRVKVGQEGQNVRVIRGKGRFWIAYEFNLTGLQAWFTSLGVWARRWISRSIEALRRLVSHPPSWRRSGSQKWFSRSPSPPTRQFQLRISPTLREIGRYPTAIASLFIITLLVGVAVFTMILIPYKQAVLLWRAGEKDISYNPRNVPPAWINFFTKEKTPSTLVLSSLIPGARYVGSLQSATGPVATVNTTTHLDIKGTNVATISYNITYPYGGFPEDLKITFMVKYKQKRPFVILTWFTPDGRTIELGKFSVVNDQTYNISQDISERVVVLTNTRKQDWLRGQGGVPPVRVLFGGPLINETTIPTVALKGAYQLQITTFTFEPNSTVDAEMVLYGGVYGLAGTDDKRRDLMVAMLWGTPVALAFGLLGAVGSSLISMVIAAAGVWYGGGVDNLLQRLTEINTLLPVLPIGLMVYQVYSKSIWVILGVIVVFNIFSSAIKNYRAIFLQAREEPYFEAARAYGASNGRIILRYLVPRVLPVLIPQLVTLIPSYVFFEATLAYLNVNDPYLPTWGKVIYEALTGGAFEGYYYWVLEPLALVILTGVAFAMLGLALDRITNPRLRGL